MPEDYHTEEVHDISEVGIKFYPREVIPELEVTSHRIRTGVGNDWTLNREKVEDYLLRQGYDLDLAADAPVEEFLTEADVNSLAPGAPVQTACSGAADAVVVFVSVGSSLVTAVDGDVMLKPATPEP